MSCLVVSDVTFIRILWLWPVLVRIVFVHLNLLTRGLSQITVTLRQLEFSFPFT